MASTTDQEFFADDMATWWEQYKQDEAMWEELNREWVQLEFDFEFAPILPRGSLCHFA